MDDVRERIILQGKRNQTLVRMITTIQAKHSCRKGFQLFSMKIFSKEKANDRVGENEMEVLNKCSVLELYEDMFPIYISGLPPHREVNFSIELIP